MLCCVVRASQDERVCTLKPTPDVLHLKRDLLPHQPWKVRLQAAEMLGKALDKSDTLVAHSAQEILKGALTSDAHWKVRRQAANSLSNLGREAVEATASSLRQVMQTDADNLVRASALQALKRYSQAVPACLAYAPPELTDDEESVVQSEGVFHGPQSATPVRNPLRDLQDELKRDFGKSSRLSESLTRLLPLAQKALSDEPVEDDCVDESTSAESQSLASHERHEFTVILDRGSNDVGLDWGFDVEPNPNGGLKVVAIQGGLIEEWNDEWPSKKVDIGDIIAKANGRSVSHSMQRVVENASQLELVIHRRKDEITL